MSGVSPATIARAEAGEGGKNRPTIMSLARGLRLLEEDAALLADWAGGLITKDEFFARFNGTGPLAHRFRSAEAWLEERGLKVSRVTVPTLPKVEFMVSEPGTGTPILGEVTAGGLVESTVFDEGEMPERIPLYYPGRARVYALRIRGDSMAPEYRPGEVLIVQDATRDDLEDGEDAVVQLDGARDGASTFKRCIFAGEGRVKLVPLNSAYLTQECRFEHIARIGKVLGTYRPRGVAPREPNLVRGTDDERS